MNAEELAKALNGKRSGDGWIARCPAHQDEHASLSLSAGSNGKILVRCHAGCEQTAVIQVLKDLGLWPSEATNNAKRIVAVYPYSDPSGKRLYESVRYEPKGFAERRPDGNGGYVWNLKGVARVLYRLPELVDADPSKPVFIVEGEKDADRLATMGLVATTNAGGAGKWRTVKDRSALHGRRLVILADNDKPGRAHAENVAASEAKTAASVKILALPGLIDKGDVSDWLNAGHTVEELCALADAAPQWASDLRAARAHQAGGNGQADKATSAAIVRRMADVHPEQVRWLWPDRIPLGKLTLFAGDPGLGKSFVSLDIAARASVGGKWPDGSFGNAATDVVLLSAEDDPADTIRPRLDRHGANVRRVHVIEAMRDVAEDGQDVSQRWTDLSRDQRHVEAVIEHVGARLLIVDPISAYLGDKTDSHRNSDVRTILGPLGEMASRTGVAVVAITHFSKGGTTNAMYRSIGSIAFVAAARMAWGFGPHRDDESKSVMLCLKCNLCPKPSGLGYRIADGRVEWDANPVDMDANDLLRDRNTEDRSACDDARDFLADVLAAGHVQAKRIKAEARDAGISWRTLERAKAELKVESFREGFGNEGGWCWRMPTCP